MLPCDYQDESEFEVKDGYYSDGEYCDKIRSEFENTTNDISNAMNNANKCDSRAFLGENGSMYQLSEKVPQNENKVVYSRCKCKIYGSDGEDKDVDSMVSDVVGGDSFLIAWTMDIDSADDEFVTDFLAWEFSHLGVNKYKESKGEEWVFANEPTMDVRLSFSNKSNDEVQVDLHGCKIINQVGNGTFVIFVKGADFVKMN